MKEYKGTIFNGDSLPRTIVCRRYVWEENCLIIYFEKEIEVIPYHAFTSAVFDKKD